MLDSKVLQQIYKKSLCQEEIFNILKAVITLKKSYIKLDNAIEDNISKCYHEKLFDSISSLNDLGKSLDCEIKDITSLCIKLYSILPPSDETSLRNFELDRIEVDILAESENCPFCSSNLVIEDCTYRVNNSDQEIDLEQLKCPSCGKNFLFLNNFQQIIHELGDIEKTNIIPIFSDFSIPKKIRYDDIIVLSNINHCTAEHHHCKNVKAMIEVIKNNGARVREYITTNYCAECDKFVLLKSDFDCIKGTINCRIIDETKKNEPTPHNYHYDTIDENETLFTQRGYNVNCIENLPEKQRQTILKQIYEHKDFSKSQILSYLDSLISQGSKKNNWAQAVSRWKADREYLSKLEELNDDEDDEFIIVPKSIKLKYTSKK